MDYPADARRKMAEKGTALPDGSFPIANERDLANALQALGRAKDRSKARAHIVARAKALGLVKSLPDDWKIQEGVLGKFTERLHPRDRRGEFAHVPNGEVKRVLLAGSKDAGRPSPFDDERLRRRKNRDHALGEATARHLAEIRAERGVEEASFTDGLHPRDRLGKFMDKINTGVRPSKGEHRAALDALDRVLPDIAGSHHAIESHKAAAIGTRLDYMAARGEALAAFGTVAFPPKLKAATEKHQDVLRSIRASRRPNSEYVGGHPGARIPR